MKIILAEDDVLFREGLGALLSQLGHTVLASAADARELLVAVDRLCSAGTDIDLVISDVRMPPTHTDEGLTAALRIRRSHPHVSVLMLSQYVGDSYAIRLLTQDDDQTSGGAGYLLKDRIGRTEDFLRSATVVASGGVVIDPKVVSALLTGAERRFQRTLSPRETEVLTLVATGLTNDEISERLFITRTAVVKHIGNIFDKLGLPRDAGNRRVLAVLRFLDAESG